MYELKFYREIDGKAYLKETIPGGNVDGLVMMAKCRIRNGEFTNAVIVDESGEEYAQVSIQDLRKVV